MASAEHSHGRTQKERGEETRQHIVDTVLKLLQKGEGWPIAKDVADAAGVSLRLVFHHFGDVEGLFRAVIQTAVARYWSNVREVGPTGPLAERVTKTVAERARLFEDIMPMQRAGRARAHLSPNLAAGIAQADYTLRTWLGLTFAPELAKACDPKALLDDLDVVASLEAWDRMRSTLHLSRKAARRAMERLISVTIAAAIGSEAIRPPESIRKAA